MKTINNRKLVKTYKNHTICEELNYKNEVTCYSIIIGIVGKDFVNSVSSDFSYFETIEEVEKFIDNRINSNIE